MERFDNCRASTLSPREERVGREPERGVLKNAPPLPGPLLHFVEERELENANAGLVKLWESSGRAGGFARD
jgi:hypothetical protein